MGLLLEVDLRLRLGGFARLQRALRPVSHEQGSGLDPMESRVREALRMERALRQAARFFPRARCLHRSLALLLWLRRRGMTAELCIGLRHAGAAVEGHAWVKWGGVVLDEDPQVGHRFETLQKAG